MEIRGRNPGSGNEIPNPFSGPKRQTLNVSFPSMGIKRGKEREVNTGDRKTSGRVEELKEVGLPARWAVFLGPGKRFPVKKVRPLPVLDAQDEGLPVLKGWLKEKLEVEGVPVEVKEALKSQKTI
ncbi:unnamed protein product [Pipistrellus nathusii]|uniref:Uncharacterized protein n=1 Tax=Pipistrellus nathusii TaxID=59473 RepID=A0ABN9ZLJ8_PIPNA